MEINAYVIITAKHSNERQCKIGQLVKLIGVDAALVDKYVCSDPLNLHHWNPDPSNFIRERIIDFTGTAFMSASICSGVRLATKQEIIDLTK
jgi:hypothetical protein